MAVLHPLIDCSPFIFLIIYISITIPSLIVATYGGGTGLATQRECLDILDGIGKSLIVPGFSPPQLMEG